MAYLDIIILAAIAFFLGYKLFSLLGSHDADKPIKTKRSTLLDAEEAPVRSAQRPNSAEGIKQTVDKKNFLQGAEAAFKMVVEAFAQGDKSTLEKLLSKDLYKTFAKTIDDRLKYGAVMEVALNRVKSSKIVEEIETKSNMEFTVEFVSEQFIANYDKKGNLISGDPHHHQEIKDRWTFSRLKNSNSPNWTIVSTEGVEDE